MKTNFEQEKGKEKSDQDTRQSLLSLYEEIQRAKYEIDPSKKKFHSEGFNRHITCIKIGNYPYGEDALYVKELEEI
ncbi:hypothetical protein IJM86_07375 [bacterium]|nr:hypothetical protein [bacterium]